MLSSNQPPRRRCQGSHDCKSQIFLGILDDTVFFGNGVIGPSKHDVTFFVVFQAAAAARGESTHPAAAERWAGRLRRCFKFKLCAVIDCCFSATNVCTSLNFPFFYSWT